MSVSLCWNVPPRISWWRRPDHEDRPGPIRRTQVDAQSGGWQHHLERAGQDRQGNRHPIGPTLQNALGAAPEHDAVTILVNSRGQPWTCNGFSTVWHRFKKALEAEGLVRPGRPSRGCAIPSPRPFAKLVWANGKLRTCWGRTPPSMARHYSRSANLADRNRITMDALKKENERRSQVVKPFAKSVKPPKASE